MYIPYVLRSYALNIHDLY